MQELENMIKIYHAAFMIFLILTIVFFVVSVILFFAFNIRGIFDMRSGRGAKRTIQKMQEMNDQTGKLRQDIVMSTPIVLSGEARISAPPTEKQGSDTWEDDPGSQETTILGSQETTILGNSHITDIQEPEKNIPQPDAEKLPGAFMIEKEIMWIHTEEIL